MGSPNQMTYEDLVDKVAKLLIYDKGEVLLDIDTDHDVWFFEKSVSPADIVRFVFEKAGLTPFVQSHQLERAADDGLPGYYECAAHGEGQHCCIDLLLGAEA